MLDQYRRFTLTWQYMDMPPSYRSDHTTIARGLMFIHDIAKWIMKYDYTSKITAALGARGLREWTTTRRTRIFIHTWHVKHRDVHKITGKLKSSPPYRCVRRHHRKASLIFPNVERNCRDRKLPFNDRAPGASIRPEAIHRDSFRRQFLITRGKDPRSLTFGASTRNAGVSAERVRRLSPSTKLRARCDWGRAARYAARTRVYTRACNVGPNCPALSRYWAADSRIMPRKTSVTRERRNWGEKYAGCGTVRSVSPFNAYR